MPEGPELRIMSDFISQKVKDITFKSFYKVEKNNTQSNPDTSISDFLITPLSYGKTLYLHLHNETQYVPVYIFMGMNGNWDWVETKNWESSNKFIRLRLESNEGHSLILYGGYMGPKWSLKAFTSKRGFDPTKEFEMFKKSIIDNLNKRAFDIPICESLLNQGYFNGIGNYLRSTILYYLKTDPFKSARETIQDNPEILELCAEIPIISYHFNGGQLRDWKNPLGKNSDEFHKWVYYQKGLSCKDRFGRTFWFDPKWESSCPYPIKNNKLEYAE